MKFEDVEVGKMYVMLNDESSSTTGATLLTKGAIVLVIEIGEQKRFKVQDQSKDKYMDGIWYTDAKNLKPLIEKEEEMDLLKALKLIKKVCVSTNCDSCPMRLFANEGKCTLTRKTPDQWDFKGETDNRVFK